MANQRQIPFLHWHRAADGIDIAYWKPSKRLRALGWTTRRIGDDSDRSAALTAAIELNKVALAPPETPGTAAPAAPRRLTFADLLDAYRASADYAEIKPATRREYEVRMRQLSHWALDGALHIDLITRDMVEDLKEALLAPGSDGVPGSRFKAAAMLRVLRVLLGQRAARPQLPVNPAASVGIPSTPARTVSIGEDEMEAVATAAESLGFPSVALAIRVGFWNMQRQADTLGFAKLAWRPIRECAPSDRPALAGPDGRVMGFRLNQGKTGAWVHAPMPPHLHPAIDAAFARGQWLIVDDLQPARQLPQWLLQRRVRKALDRAGFAHVQYRDLRRSGMVNMGAGGADLQGITSISGHQVIGRKTILDTYMPANARAACHAMATVLRTRAANLEQEQQG